MKQSKFKCAFCGRVFERSYLRHRCSDGNVTKNFRKKQKKACLKRALGPLWEFEYGELFVRGCLGVRQICIHESTSSDQLEFHFYDGQGKFLPYGHDIPRGAAFIVGEVEK